MTARSFSVAVSSPDGLARPLAAARAEVTSPAGGLLFVSGALSQEIDRIAEQVRAAWRNVPVCIVPAAGVITERGEIEGASGVAGLLWSGGRATPFVVGEAGSVGALREAITGAAGGRASTMVLFPRSEFAADLLDGLGAVAPNVSIFGAGTVGGACLTLTSAGEALRGRVSGLAIHGLSPPLVQASAACRLLTSLGLIEEASGGMVLRIDGQPALDALSACMPELRAAAQGAAQQPQPVVFAALADAEPIHDGAAGGPKPRAPSEPYAGEEPRFVLRPVRGIDPTRRGVLIGPEAKPGGRLAFAVRDAAAARAGLESAARTVSQQALGAAPRFAIFVSCAGRGQGLYGSPDVEARILRQRFGDLPIAGMHSAFEIVPWGPGDAKVALYTGVVALFRSPS